jgi:hypothetical protein
MAAKNGNGDLPPIGFCMLLLLGSKYVYGSFCSGHAKKRINLKNAKTSVTFNI